MSSKWVIKQGRQLANIDNALDLPGDSMVKNLPVNIGDVEYLSLIPGSGRSLGEGSGNPPQHSCLENSMDRGAWYSLWGRKKPDTTEQLTLSPDVT